MEITTTIDVNAPLALTWELFGEQFGDIGAWAESIEKSSLDGPAAEGAVRTCHLKAFGPVPAGVITEELTVFDRKSHELTYVVLSGLPKMMRKVVNAWTVEAVDATHTRVTSVATFDLAWWIYPMVPVMRIQMKQGLKDFVQQFQTHVDSKPETDKASDSMADPSLSPAN